jgi:hypothetical protein
MNKGIFRTDFGAVERPEDPESLFRDLKRSPTSNLRHLWSHQADLLREYNKNHLKTPNLALELPTGAGKTLVGLLIADFRRLRFDERVAYLCPTRQLAKQVGAQAGEYGIRAHVLVGPQSEYSAKDFNKYKEGAATAITTYSGLFNINPRINDPQVIILDDAHAGENYISDLWSVEITRQNHPQLFGGLIDLIKDVLPAGFTYRLSADDVPPREQRDVELVPGQYLRDLSSPLQDLFDSALSKPDPAWFSWQLIKDHLTACNLFISWATALIRPIVPPTKTHSAFSQAHQRVYMSATLGSGGELERVTGIEKIERLPIPAGWERQGTGRRLILIPELSFDPQTISASIAKSIVQSNRALVLVPNSILRGAIEEELSSQGIQVFGPRDIEESLDAFVTQNDCALLLANRYDGLDLPDEACRLLVIYGLPCGTNLQESFLLTRLAATSLLRDRILTRISQGLGRCTRSDSDYATVFLCGTDLTEFLLKVENRKCLHPELQAEIEFGIENSKEITEGDLQDLIHALLDQTKDWEGAERTEDVVAQHLLKIARDEVSYVYALWHNDFETALVKAKAISDKLEGTETQGYRGWWYYLHGDTALMLFHVSGDARYVTTATDSFRRAAKCTMSISWLTELARLKVGEKSVASTEEVDRATARSIEGIKAQIVSLGFVGHKFEKEMAAFLGNIKKDDHKSFHQGLKMLGRLLGFNAEVPKTSGAPDCVWSLEGIIHIAHEAKTEQTPNDPIAKIDVQKATGHRAWIEANRPLEPGAQILCLLETPRETLQSDAAPHAKDLYRVTANEVRDIANGLVSMLRKVRAQSTMEGDEKLTEILFQELKKMELLPKQLIDRLKHQPVTNLRVVGL